MLRLHRSRHQQGGEPNNTEFYDHSLLFTETEQDIKKQVVFRLNDRGRIAGWVTRSVIGVGSVPIAATWLYDAGRNVVDFEELSDLPDASNPLSSWATAVSERGAIAGMTATPHAVFGDNFLANAAVWQRDGAAWSRLDLDLGQDRDAGLTARAERAVGALPVLIARALVVRGNVSC